MFWIVNQRDGKSLVLGSEDGERWLVFNDPANMEAVNLSLRMPGDEYPDPQLRFQHMLIALLHDPRIRTCGPGFASQSDRVLETYTFPGGANVDVLREACGTDPIFRRDETSWSSEIRILDHTGAVREVQMTGGSMPLSIAEFAMRDVLPEGTFYFADEF